MLRVDICISGGGQTIHELARVGVPTIGICFAKNQTRNLEEFQKKNFLKYLGKYTENSLFNNISLAIESFRSPTERKRKSSIGRSLIDGKGARRVVREAFQPGIFKITRLDCFIRKANKSDCRVLWIWRNHPETRKKSFDTKAVKYTDHRLWFDKKLKDKRAKIYIVENGENEMVGQARFEKNSNEKIYINVNLNPDFFNKGLGSEVIKAASNNFITENPDTKEIIAEILTENIASRKAFCKAGYIFSHNISKRGKEVFVFKLKN